MEVPGAANGKLPALHSGATRLPAVHRRSLARLSLARLVRGPNEIASCPSTPGLMPKQRR